MKEEILLHDKQIQFEHDLNEVKMDIEERWERSIDTQTIGVLTVDAVRSFMAISDKVDILKNFQQSFSYYYSAFSATLTPDKCESCYAKYSGQCDGGPKNAKVCLSRMLNWILWKPERTKIESENEETHKSKKKNEKRERRDTFDETQTQTINRWIKGTATSVPYAETLKALSLIFSCTIDDLLSGEVGDVITRTEGFNSKQVQGNYLIYHCPPGQKMNIGALHIYPFGKKLKAKYLIHIERSALEDFLATGIEFFRGKSVNMLYEGEVIFCKKNIYLQFDACDRTDKLYAVLFDTYTLQENVLQQYGTMNESSVGYLGGGGVCATLKMNSDYYVKEPFAYPVCLSRKPLSEQDEKVVKDNILSNNGTKVEFKQGINFVEMLVRNGTEMA